MSRWEWTKLILQAITLSLALLTTIALLSFAFAKLWG